MSSIHYFQRYSQPENVATNNTLLLLSRLYQHSPNKFKGFLNELLGDNDLEAGVSFNQQRRGNGSIPDGHLSQASFKVVVETKLHQHFSIRQLKSHLKSFDNEEHKILLSLSPRLPRPALFNQIESEIQTFNITYNTSIKYIPTTFSQIVEKFKSTLQDYDFELISLIDDYEDYCIHDRLITDDEYRMRAVTCGWTLSENFQYNLYYDKVEDGYSEHSYIGIYKNKSIRGIGKLENIIEADYINGQLQIKNSTASITSEQEQNIKDVIVAAKKNNNWDISLAHNFFCVEKFHPTDFKKQTKYPLQGTKFFNLKNELNLTTLPSTDIIAELLRTKAW
ncbi:hypothetical protein [Pontibacter roseus]|uniref:hypothetical protein n=1 Tax=Pontibacter roseus TaxID=336989 RepID=UPI000366AC40|nr:hypothetical protein [Pontibacter roseus]